MCARVVAAAVDDDGHDYLDFKAPAREVSRSGTEEERHTTETEGPSREPSPCSPEALRGHGDRQGTKGSGVMLDARVRRGSGATGDAPQIAPSTSRGRQAEQALSQTASAAMGRTHAPTHPKVRPIQGIPEVCGCVAPCVAKDKCGVT